MLSNNLVQFQGQDGGQRRASGRRRVPQPGARYSPPAGVNPINFNNGPTNSNLERQEAFRSRPNEQPPNSRSAKRLLQNEIDTCATGDDYSQFQIYCDTTYEQFQADVPRMKFPLLGKFFSNEMPGYVALFDQSRGNARYYGETYWLGWVIPFWLSFPANILSDSDKRKLLIFWIARNRLDGNKMPFRKLSVLLSTYFPHNAALDVRNNQIQELNLQRSAQNPDQPLLSPLINIVDSADLNFVYPSLDERNFVAGVRSGKGADLTYVKNIPLSLVAERILSGRQDENNPGYDEWLLPHPLPGEPPIVRSDDEKDRNPSWDDTFTKTPFDNDADRLLTFIQNHLSELAQILDRFGNNWQQNHPDPYQQNQAQGDLMKFLIAQYLYSINLPDLSRYNQSSPGVEVPISQS